MLNPKDYIDAEISAFANEPETARAESTLRELLATYDQNTKLEHVLTKVVTINALYHARVLDVDLHPLAIHIWNIKDLDSKLKQGNPDAVDAIWKSQGTRKHYFSFVGSAPCVQVEGIWISIQRFRVQGLRLFSRNREAISSRIRLRRLLSEGGR